MKFGIEKCAILLMKSSKTTPDGWNGTAKIKTKLERSKKRKPPNTWGILEADTIKQVDMKENIKK